MTERNITLILLDTVRKDFFDAYAPRLQSLADVSFEQCRAASSWSTPSHASIMTGVLPHQHGIHTHNRDFSQIHREDTFLNSMPNHQALGASANVFASSTFGFDTAFDDYSDVAPHRRFPDGMDMERFIQDRAGDGPARYLEFLGEAFNHEYTLQSLANGAIFKFNDLLRRAPIPKLFDDGASVVAKEGISKVRASDEPFFLFTNFMDAHGPVHNVLGYDDDMFSAPNTWSSFEFDNWEINEDGDLEGNSENIQYHRELYSAAIDYLDRKVSDFVRQVQTETDRETTFIITADHGENLGYPADEELFGHTSSLTESLLHVPCYIINPPEGYDSQEDQYFSHLKLGDLISGMAHGETPDVFADRIAAELIGIGVGGAPEDEEAYRYWDRMLRCTYEDETKWMWDSLGNSVQYTIDQGRPSWQEQNEEQVKVPDWACQFFDKNIEEYKKQAKAAEESWDDAAQETQKRLKDLGYL